MFGLYLFLSRIQFSDNVCLRQLRTTSTLARREWRERYCCAVGWVSMTVKDDHEGFIRP